MPRAALDVALVMPQTLDCDIHGLHCEKRSLPSRDTSIYSESACDTLNRAFRTRVLTEPLLFMLRGLVLNHRGPAPE